MILRLTVVTGLLGVLIGCPGPRTELPVIDTASFELDAEGWPLQGPVFGESWIVFQAFAIEGDDGSYQIFAAPGPVNNCDDQVRFEEDVVHGTINSLGAAPWGKGGSVTIGTAEGTVSTQGGGYDLALDVTGAKVEGGFVFEIDAQTDLNGQISAVICPK